MKNEGTIERALQTLISVALFSGAFFWVDGGWQILLFVLASAVAFFAVIGFCPMYKLLGINTYKNNK
ncbi:MAG: hypothetical protein US63_C0012G0009 [Candidatus Moranbacteria bacterium GW2011_GWC2_37_8]|nr:MAG: hypothetical protein US63_C0012G0009 [Candidatus Moranbacteria bacterium GW2011_GWC2_37_8]KKQ62863.1 MAG: hypothetical protein US82_C0005G0036 [Parcubacteria group bacterium GW2011_GWC1_38_22]KKQ79386.1 MAG: hypothetical protein UT03_C0059G0004 [Candidatus Moranbacteria bacterium GW2011_GWD2_38_7]